MLAFTSPWVLNCDGFCELPGRFLTSKCINKFVTDKQTFELSIAVLAPSNYKIASVWLAETASYVTPTIAYWNTIRPTRLSMLSAFEASRLLDPSLVCSIMWTTDSTKQSNIKSQVETIKAVKFVENMFPDEPAQLQQYV